MRYLITKEIEAVSVQDALKAEAKAQILSVIPKPDDFNPAFGYQT